LISSITAGAIREDREGARLLANVAVRLNRLALEQSEQVFGENDIDFEKLGELTAKTLAIAPNRLLRCPVEVTPRPITPWTSRGLSSA
jgi:hypothetical protein